MKRKSITLPGTNQQLFVGSEYCIGRMKVRIDEIHESGLLTVNLVEARPQDAFIASPYWLT